MNISLLGISKVEQEITYDSNFFKNLSSYRGNDPYQSNKQDQLEKDQEAASHLKETDDLLKGESSAETKVENLMNGEFSVSYSTVPKLHLIQKFGETPFSVFLIPNFTQRELQDFVNERDKEKNRELYEKQKELEEQLRLQEEAMIHQRALEEQQRLEEEKRAEEEAARLQRASEQERRIYQQEKVKAELDRLRKQQELRAQQQKQKIAEERRKAAKKKVEAEKLMQLQQEDAKIREMKELREQYLKRKQKEQEARIAAAESTEAAIREKISKSHGAKHLVGTDLGLVFLNKLTAQENSQFACNYEKRFRYRSLFFDTPFTLLHKNYYSVLGHDEFLY